MAAAPKVIPLFAFSTVMLKVAVADPAFTRRMKEIAPVLPSKTGAITEYWVPSITAGRSSPAWARDGT